MNDKYELMKAWAQSCGHYQMLKVLDNFEKLYKENPTAVQEIYIKQVAV